MDQSINAIRGLAEKAHEATDLNHAVQAAAAHLHELVCTAQITGGLDVEAAVFDLFGKVGQATTANSALAFAIMALERAEAENERGESELDRYRLWETPSGAQVYRVEMRKHPDEPIHYLCPLCVEDKRKSILQGDRHAKSCQLCKSTFDFDPRPGLKRT